MELKGAALVRVPPALNRASVRALRDALASASADPGACAIVLRGTDAGVFCRGLDIEALASGEDPAEAAEMFGACLRDIRRCPKPVICLVEGNADGGGVGIVAAADAVFATLQASFALPELLLGLTPAIVLPYLSERLSPQRLRWLALTTDRIDAFAAAALGLVDQVTPADRCGAAIESCISRLRRLREDAVFAWKCMTLAHSPVGSHDGVDATVRRLRNPEIVERLRRFAEGGEPPWAVEQS